MSRAALNWRLWSATILRVAGVDLSQATHWFSSRDIITGAEQLLPNRGSGAVVSAQRGSTEGVDTVDPLFLSHTTGSDYVYLPGTSGNSVTFPRPFATTHFTITRTDESVVTGTTTADPVVIGDVTHSGTVVSVVLRETDGDGSIAESLVVTNGLTGWTVNRSTSGIKTAVVTRPVMLLDGTDDYGQLPASTTPTFTATSGKHTVVVAFRVHHVTAGWNYIYSSYDDSEGLAIRMPSSADDIKGIVRGSSALVSTTKRDIVLGDFIVGAVVCDDGAIRAYESTLGFTADADYTAVGTITHQIPRLGTLALGGLPSSVEVFEVLDYPGEALTEEELDNIAATLIAGSYPSVEPAIPTPPDLYGDFLNAVDNNPIPASSADIYAAPADHPTTPGLVGNTGTLESPWTLEKGVSELDAAAANTHLRLLGGTYPMGYGQGGWNEMTMVSATGWKFIRGHSLTDPAILAAGAGGSTETNGNTFANGTYSIVLAHLNSERVGIADLVIDGALTTDGDHIGIRLKTTDHSWIKNVIVKNCPGGGISYSNGNDWGMVEGCIVTGNSLESGFGSSGISTIAMQDLLSSGDSIFNHDDGVTYGVIIRNNVCFDNRQEVLSSLISGDNITNADAGERIYDGNGIILDHNAQYGYARNGLVENNACFNNGGRGIQITRYDNATVRYNTTYGNNRWNDWYPTTLTSTQVNSSQIECGVNQTGAGSNDCVMYGNIHLFVQDGTSWSTKKILGDGVAPGADVVSDYNVLFSLTGSAIVEAGIVQTNTISSDPSLTAPVDDSDFYDNLKPGIGSSAHNVAFTGRYYPIYDILGATRDTSDKTCGAVATAVV